MADLSVNWNDRLIALLGLAVGLLGSRIAGDAFWESMIAGVAAGLFLLLIWRER